jgi:hypothetical protein
LVPGGTMHGDMTRTRSRGVLKRTDVEQRENGTM